jgi:hypothetical protein
MSAALIEGLLSDRIGLPADITTTPVATGKRGWRNSRLGPEPAAARVNWELSPLLGVSGEYMPTGPETWPAPSLTRRRYLSRPMSAFP